MRGFAAIWAVSALCICGGMAAGCRSLTSPPPDGAGGLVREETGFDWVRAGLAAPEGEGTEAALSEEARRAAEAYASYALGVLHELNGEKAEAEACYDRAAEAEPDAQEILERRASIRFAQGKNEEAVRLVEDFHAAHPGEEWALAWLIRFYLETDEPERVAQLTRLAAEAHPEAVENWLRLAIVQEQLLHDSAGLEESVRRGIARASKPQPLRVILAKLLEEKGATALDAPKKLRSEAFRNVQNILKEEPDNTEMRRMLGRLQLAGGDLREALETFTAIDREQAGDVKLKAQIASDLRGGETPDKAVERLEAKAGARGMDKTFLHSYMGMLLVALDRRDEALAAFGKAVELHPDDAGAWILLALAQRQDGTGTEAARETLARAEAANPENPRLLSIAGQMAAEEGDWDAAADSFARAAELADDGLEGMESLAGNFSLALTHLGRSDEAAEWLDRAAEQDENGPRAWLGEILAAAEGDEGLASRALDVLDTWEAAGGGPPDELSFMRAMLLMREGRKDEALEAFAAAETAAKDNPASVASYDHFHFMYAVALDETGHRDEAMARLERCLRINPDHAGALNYQAYTWACEGIRLYDALRAVQRALKRDPRNPAYLDTLGWVYFQLGYVDTALKALEAALALDPDDETIADHVRQAKEKQSAESGKKKPEILPPDVLSLP
jgi:tetratricopeptide (TPR) repeat protein